MKSAMMFMVMAWAAIAHAGRLPDAPTIALPSGYEVMARAHVTGGKPLRDFEILAVRRKDEADWLARTGTAPPRPLLIYQRRGAAQVIVSRNDHVVMKANEGGQCDPFLDGGAGITAKGRYFTVENGVSCGTHWTDYITFRLDDRACGFVFDNERRETWQLNPDNDPNAEALILADPPRVTAARPGAPVALASWRPADE